jgi:hypothetical protein
VHDGLRVVAVGIAQEDAVVARVVLRPLARRVQHLGPGGDRGVVHGVDGGAVGRGERDVQLDAGRTVGGQPELGRAAGACEAHHLAAAAVGEADRLVDADGREDAGVEGDGGVDVAAGDSDVIEHDVTVERGSDSVGRGGDRPPSTPSRGASATAAPRAR